MNQFRCIFVVHENAALAVHRSKFRLPAQRQSTRNGTVRSVDGGRVFPAPIESEHALADRVIHDGVRVRVRLDGADGLQRLQVENRDVVAAAVAGESTAKVGGDGDAVHALRIGNIAFHGIRIRVHDHGVRSSRDVHAASAAVHIHVIPPALAAKRDGLDHLVAGSAGRGRRKERVRCETEKQCRQSQTCQSYEIRFIAHSDSSFGSCSPCRRL